MVGHRPPTPGFRASCGGGGPYRPERRGFRYRGDHLPDAQRTTSRGPEATRRRRGAPRADPSAARPSRARVPSTRSLPERERVPSAAHRSPDPSAPPPPRRAAPPRAPPGRSLQVIAAKFNKEDHTEGGAQVHDHDPLGSCGLSSRKSRTVPRSRRPFPRRRVPSLLRRESRRTMARHGSRKAVNRRRPWIAGGRRAE